jgi:hypothetical protein
VDSRASLTDRFNASVNVGTSTNFTNNFNSSTLDYLSNTFQSNVQWNHLWSGKPYSLAVGAAAQPEHAEQDLRHHPAHGATFNVQRIFPGRRGSGEACGR